ncbi:MAG: DUF1127 domain-containing protein [Tistlia sp.]|uniref:DUF1127 domain-containing protein n=1 Tax=Tistlia sp. TaxID=3057121 RepID=UPI0034A222B3
MTRLIDLEGQRRIDAALLPFESPERLMMRARREQARYMGELTRMTVSAVTRVTGLAALSDSLRRHTVYRRTVDELSQLDDAVLADIGMTRSEIRRRALECSRDAVPARQRWWNRAAAWLATVRDEQRTVRELSALDERMLRDIGIEPGSLRGTAERMTGPSRPMVIEAVSALREAAVVIFTPFKQARDQQISQALTEVGQTTGKRAA